MLAAPFPEAWPPKTSPDFAKSPAGKVSASMFQAQHKRLWPYKSKRVFSSLQVDWDPLKSLWMGNPGSSPAPGRAEKYLQLLQTHPWFRTTALEQEKPGRARAVLCWNVTIAQPTLFVIRSAYPHLTEDIFVFSLAPWLDIQVLKWSDFVSVTVVMPLPGTQLALNKNPLSTWKGLEDTVLDPMPNCSLLTYSKSLTF